MLFVLPFSTGSAFAPRKKKHNYVDRSVVQGTSEPTYIEDYLMPSEAIHYISILLMEISFVPELVALSLSCSLMQLARFCSCQPWE